LIPLLRCIKSLHSSPTEINETSRSSSPSEVLLDLCVFDIVRDTRVAECLEPTTSHTEWLPSCVVFGFSDCEVNKECARNAQTICLFSYGAFLAEHLIVKFVKTIKMRQKSRNVLPSFPWNKIGHGCSLREYLTLTAFA